jgi:Thioesterase domain
MTAKETRVCTASFLLQNDQMSSMRDNGIMERPPFFFVGTDKLNGKLGGDQTVICLPLLPLLKYASDMEEAVEELINYIMSIQDEGPYLLGGYCNGGYVAYEIARRLASRGHRVDLLALVESPGVGQADRLFKLRRRLLFSVTWPMELLSCLTAKLAKIAYRYIYNYMNIDNVDLHREFDTVFGVYCWARLRRVYPPAWAASHSSTAPRPWADHQDQPVLGVVGDVVPVIPAVIIGRAGRVAVILLLAHEGPLLIVGPRGYRGEKATNSSWVAWA